MLSSIGAVFNSNKIDIYQRARSKKGFWYPWQITVSSNNPVIYSNIYYALWIQLKKMKK